MQAISTLINDARKDAGLSQRALASAAGTSQPALVRYESGEQLPTLPTLERLLAACGVSLMFSTRRSSSPIRPVSSIRGQTGELATILRRNRPQLLAAAHVHGIFNVRVFGSVARGDAHSHSDIDLLVELVDGRTLLDLEGFRIDAKRITGRSVDVATADTLKPNVRAAAVAESVGL